MTSARIFFSLLFCKYTIKQRENKTVIHVHRHKYMYMYTKYVHVNTCISNMYATCTVPCVCVQCTVPSVLLVSLLCDYNVSM